MDTFITDGWQWSPVQAEDVEREVRRLAHERPDFVYKQLSGAKSCLYTHPGNQPGCIIGSALAALGQTIPVDHDWNEETGVDSLGDLGLIQGDTSWLDKVQYHQDCGHTWSTAVKMADEAGRSYDF